MHNTWLEHALVQVYNLFMASKSGQQWQMLTATYLHEFPEIAASNAKKRCKISCFRHP